jgi:hypothetical protein
MNVTIEFHPGEPPACGEYLVTDGEEIGRDLWWEYTPGTPDRVRFARDHGTPGGVRRWSRYVNVTGWAYKTIPQEAS